MARGRWPPACMPRVRSPFPRCARWSLDPPPRPRPARREAGGRSGRRVEDRIRLPVAVEVDARPLSACGGPTHVQCPLDRPDGRLESVVRQAEAPAHLLGRRIAGAAGIDERVIDPVDRGGPHRAQPPVRPRIGRPHPRHRGIRVQREEALLVARPRRTRWWRWSRSSVTRSGVPSSSRIGQVTPNSAASGRSERRQDAVRRQHELVTERRARHRSIGR